MANNTKKSGSGDKMLDWVVILSALILYAKTADVLSFFSPTILNDILGFDVSFVYGMVTAALVEGLALTLHFNKRAKLSSAAQIVKWIALGISGLCQVFDGFITTETTANMSETLKFALAYGVPLIPLLIVVMVFSIGHLPEDDEVRPFKGLKNILVPNFSRFWNGEGEQNFVSPSAVSNPALDENEKNELVRQLTEEIVRQVGLSKQVATSDNGASGKEPQNQNFI